MDAHPLTDMPLRDWGSVDLMVIDQALRGRIRPGARIADLGCGAGRNIGPLLKNFEVWGCDVEPQAVAMCRQLATQLGADSSRFQVENIETNTLPKAAFDFVIANAVLHFAHSQEHFLKMVRGMCELLDIGGVAIARLATEDLWPTGAPHSGFTYLAGIDELKALTHDHRCELADPLKTVVIDGMRTMTTWVFRRVR